MPESRILIKWQALSPYLLSVLRVIVAFLFMQHGTMKLFAFPTGVGPDGGTVELFSQFGLAGILEVFGGFLMLVGLFTRPVAFILSGEMAVAYFQFLAPRGFWSILNHGELVILFCFAWLFFSSAGPGPLSLDALRRKRK